MSLKKVIIFCINNFDNFSNGVFFIISDIDSKKNLKHIMNHYNKSLRITNMKKSDHTHLSIGGRLNS